MGVKRKSKVKKFPVRKINKKISGKLVGLFFVVILALVALAIRITSINVSNGAEYTRIVLQTNQQQYSNTTIAYKRGDILDRNGNILATSERVYKLILDCSIVNYEVKDDSGKTSQPYIEPTVNALSKFFGLDKDELYSKLESDETKNSQYQILISDVTMEQKEEFEEYTDLTDEDRVDSLSDEEYKEIYNIRGVWFEDSYRRVYPQNSLACDVIGFTNSSNEADWGIEGYYNEILNGTDGRSFGYFNSDSDVEQTIIEPKDGNNVVSTCDINIQEIVRNAIEDFMAKYAGNGNDAAKNVAVVVMDPNNGEVLAMDSTDWYDLNNPRDLTSFVDASELSGMTDEQKLEKLNSIWRNFCISDAFEPGSTFKPVTIAAALEMDTLETTDTFICDGYQDINGSIIRCSSYPNVHGELDVEGGINQSCNDLLMQVAEELGADSLLKYQSLFNFGKKTGIDLPGENTGILYDTDTMGAVELATTSFGQGFTCTMIQEAAAISSIINGGYYYTPHVVKSITNSDGNLVESIDGTVKTQTVSHEVSDFIKKAMGSTVERGTAMDAKVEGYTMGGKTGTAEKFPRSEGKYMVSYIGFAPLDNPEVLVYVIVDEPNLADGQEITSSFAQEISKQIMTELLPYMNIYQDEPGYTDSQSEEGSGVEYGTSNPDTSAPIEGEEDETVLYGGNDMYSDGVENDALNQ